jgi:hypothetical protein
MEHLNESGDIRIRFTFESLVGNLVQLVMKCLSDEKQDRKDDVVMILKSILTTINVLGKVKDFFGSEDISPTASTEQILNLSASKIGKGLPPPVEISLQLYMMGALAANQANEEELCYSFFVEV